MKAKSLFFTLLMSIGTFVSAQFYMGPRVGLNLANQSTNSAGYANTMKMGLCGGLTTKYKFSKYLSVSLDALFSQMGTNTNITVNNPDGKPLMITDYAFTYNYVSVPLVLNMEWPISSKRLMPYRQGGSVSSFHVSAGGMFGYALGVSNSFTTTDYSADPAPAVVTSGGGSVDSKGYNAMDFGVVAGTGFNFEMDPRNFVGFDARYIMGFANVATAKGVTTTNSAIQVTLAYTYKLTTRNIRY